MKPDTKRLRQKYMDNPPEGMTSEDIRRMSEDDLNILVRVYRCSGGTDTANPAAGNCCSGTGIPHLIDCLLPASLLA